MLQPSPLRLRLSACLLVLVALGCSSPAATVSDAAVDAIARGDVHSDATTLADRASIDVLADGATLDAVTDGAVLSDGPVGTDTPLVTDVARLPDGAFPLPPADTVSYTGTFSTGTGMSQATLMTALEGLPRDVGVYVPTSAGANPPLLLLFHGTGGSGEEIISDANATEAADAAGFVVVAPTSNWISTGDFDHPTAETYWLTYPQDDPNTNVDLVLVRACIVEAMRVYHVDPSRVFAIGHSSGGFLATTVAMSLRDRIAAYAENSSGLVKCTNTSDCTFQAPDGGDTCASLMTMPGWCNCTGAEKPITINTTPGRMPAVFMGHGTADPDVSVYYTCALGARLQALGYINQTVLRVGDGHDIPDTFISDVWPFLMAHPRQ